MSVCGCILIKLYLQNQVLGQTWASGNSLIKSDQTNGSQTGSHWELGSDQYWGPTT